MATTQTKLEVLISAPPRELFAHMCDPQNYRGLQPLLSHIGSSSHDSDPNGQPFVHYEITEKINVLWVFPLFATSKVWMRPNALKLTIEETVEAGMGVRLVVDSSFTARGNGTHVVRLVSVHAPGWLLGYVRVQANKAQRAVLANLKKRFEKPGG